jgi:hypothetical protein
MSNQPWECPRCHRINAPFNHSCFCQPEKPINGLEKYIAACNKYPIQLIIPPTKWSEEDE